MIDSPCEWGAATFLIFSENVGALVYYTHVLSLFISLFLGVQIFINNPRQLLNRVLFFMTAMFALWVYFDLILWASPTPEMVVFFWSAIVPVELLIYLSGLYLVYLFYTQGKDAPLRYKIFAALTMLPIILFMHTRLNVVGIAPDCDEGAVEGPLIMYMYIVEVLLIFLIGFITFRGSQNIKSLGAKKNLKLVGIGTILFLGIFSLGNLTLVFSLGPYYEQFKLLGMPVFAGVVLYTIVKHGAFKMPIFVTDVLVSALWILLFSLILLDDLNVARVIIVITLIIFGVIGIQLSRSVKKEIEQREEIEKLAVSLEHANDRLKELDKLKSEFVSIASHQLRSPLTSIRGYTSLIMEGTYGAVPEKMQEPLSRIVDSTATMASSIDDYLNVSRIQAGNMKYELIDFNLRDEVAKIAEDIKAQGVKKGLQVLFQDDLSRSPIVNADAGKVRQILHNLSNNAIKYTEAGQVILFVHDSRRDNVIYVDIIDTGIGMSEETLAILFGKFERSRKSHNINVTGTGLGLYIAREMARKMGGDIIAISEGEGKGSMFRFSLPLRG